MTDPGAGGEGGRPRRRRSRVVLWVSVAAAISLSVLLAVLASSKPAGQVSTGSPLIGKAAPAISGRNLIGGGNVTLNGFRGRWVLVNFAASWCIPCREEMPQLLSFSASADRAGSTNAVVLTVEYDEADLSSLISLLRSQHATWPTVDDGQAVVRYGVGGLPESYLVDPQGTVIAKYVGQIVASQLGATISKLSFGTA